MNDHTDAMGFGLIGCGRVAPRHAQSVQELPAALLVATGETCFASRTSRQGVGDGTLRPSDSWLKLQRHWPLWTTSGNLQ